MSEKQEIRLVPDADTAILFVQKLTVKTQVYLSAKDEMVSVRSGREFQNNACVCVRTPGASGHFYYAQEDPELLQADFCDMIRAHQTVPV